MGFGNGAFQAARIAIDGVTIIQNIVTNKIQAAAVVSNTNQNTNTIPIVISNNENISTPAPFQQMIQATNLSQFSNIASDLSNIYFSSDEAGQNKLYSWRERGTSHTQTVIWWVLLPNGIPANSTTTIYLQTSSSSTIDGVYTGVAPNLTSTYGQYDNGASIFNNYWNFAGTSLPSGWNTLTTGQPQVLIYYQTNNSNPFVLDAYIVSGGRVMQGISTSTSASGGPGYGYSLKPSINAYGDDGTTWGIYYNTTLLSSLNGINLPAVQSVGYTNGQAIAANGNPYNYAVVSQSYMSTSSVNYIFLSSDTYGCSSGAAVTVNNNLHLQVSTGGFGYIDNIIQWVRTRAYPPNGIMPTAALNVQPLAATNNSNIWAVPQIFNATTTFNEGIENAAPQSTLLGTTAGSIVYSMPEQGSSYKKFIAYVNGYENDKTTAQTITFPTAFTEPPVITTNTTGLTLSASTSTLTINAPDSTATYTGWIIIEGY